MDAEDDLMTLVEVRRFFGGTKKPMSVSTIYRWIQMGALPKPIRMSRTTIRWKRSEVQAARDQMERNSQVT